MSFAEKPITSSDEIENQLSPAETFKLNEENIAQKRQAITEAMTAGDYEKVATLAQEAKRLEVSKSELMDVAIDDADKEVGERKMYDEAKAEDAEHTAAKEKLAAEEQEKHAEFVRQSEEADQKRIAEIMKEIKGEDVENSPTPEKAEGAFEQMKAQYNDVLEKIKIKSAQLQELVKKREALNEERRSVEGTGNQQRLEEINKELEENSTQQQNIEEGEQYIELRKKQKEEEKANNISTYNKPALQKQDDKFGEELTALYNNSKNEDIGLRNLKFKEKELILEFKKAHGYDKVSASEIDNKLDRMMIGEADMNRVMMNNFFGTNMPIFSKELKLSSNPFDGKAQLVANSGQEGADNHSLIAKKQVELWQQATDAAKAIEGISKDTLRQLIEENRLEYSAIMNNSAVKEIYQPLLRTNTASGGEIIYPSSKRYPQDVENFVDETDKNRADVGYIFAQKGAANERWIKNMLFLKKMAKEKGLI